MNTTIAKFMSLAITVIIISALIFVSMTNTLSSETDKYKTHIDGSMNELLKSPTP